MDPATCHDSFQAPPHTDCALRSAILAAAYVRVSGNEDYESRYEETVQLNHPSLEHCKEHTDILKYLHSKFTDPTSYWKVTGPISAIVVEQFLLDSSKSRISCRTVGEPYEVPRAEFNLQQHQSHPKSIARDLVADWKSVAIEKLKGWKDSCLEAHGERCEIPHPIYQTSRVIPLWLVDTEQQCLVAGCASMTYVTLSYVWGKSSKSTLHCVKNNLHLLQQSEALSNPPFVQEIPDTIRDAIHLIPLLGEKYLWVDSLCIVQDDEDTRSNELNNMGSIYATSRLTIVADTADSWQGLLGIDISKPRDIQQIVIPFGIYGSLVAGPMSKEGKTMDLVSGPYFQRGWCFQECILAKRRLIFSEGRKMVRWYCQQQEFFEDVVPMDGKDYAQVDKDGNSDLIWLNRPYPCLASYRSLVFSYSDKELTFDQDSLPAFSGILKLLSQTFHGGFLFGLPELFFDIALAWRVEYRGIGIRKPLPSWS